MINPDSLAKGVAAGAKNTAFSEEVTIVPIKPLIVGTYDPLKVATVDNVPIAISSAAQAGDLFGFGYMIHRLAERLELGTQGQVLMSVVPQSETGVIADGSIDFAGSTGVKSGVLPLYFSGDQVDNLTVADADDEDAIAIKVAAAIMAQKECPVIAAVDGVTTSKVNVTSKSKGLWGNEITIEFNLDVGDVLPTGVTAAVVDMANGTTVPDIDAALAGLGAGDDANENYYTELVHGYGLDTDTLDKISAYVGEGNELDGLYDSLVARPFRALTGDNTAGSGGLAALLVITDARLTDRANGIISVPGSPSHPSEIAASASGEMGRVNNVRAEESYTKLALRGVRPGPASDRWSNTYIARDSAVKSGISPTVVVAGVVQMQNIVTFYRPADVPVASNGYRSMRDISITRNILASSIRNFSQEKWSRISIVNDISDVTNPVDVVKARDIVSVRNDLVALVTAWAGNAWLFDKQFSLDALKEAGSVVVRSGGTGFDYKTKVVYSGEGGILNGIVEFDINPTVVIN